MKDGPALLIELSMLSAMLSILLLIAWRSFGRAPHALTWSVSYALGAICYTFNAADAGGTQHNLVHFFVLSSVTFFINSLWVRGYRQRAHLPLYTMPVLVAIALGIAALWFFTFHVPYIGIMIAINPLFMAITLFLSARAALRDQFRWKRRANAAELASAIIQTLFGCLELVMMVVALRIGRVPDPSTVRLYNAFINLGLPSFYIGNGIVNILIIASDLATRMERLAQTDTLTVLLNRRGFEREADAAMAKARARRSSLAAVLADIDHFKRVNDLHGHGVGDVALMRFSAYLRDSLPQVIPVGRLGGEEFVFLIPEANEEEALQLVETIRTGVSTISLAEFDAAPFTASFGITFFEPADRSLIDILARADVALYQAKATGRNRTVLFDPSLRPLHIPRSERPMPV